MAGREGEGRSGAPVMGRSALSTGAAAAAALVTRRARRRRRRRPSLRQAVSRGEGSPLASSPFSSFLSRSASPDGVGSMYVFSVSPRSLLFSPSAVPPSASFLSVRCLPPLHRLCPTGRTDSRISLHRRAWRWRRTAPTGLVCLPCAREGLLSPTANMCLSRLSALRQQGACEEWEKDTCRGHIAPRQRAGRGAFRPGAT